MNYDIALVGYGFVGKALHKLFGDLVKTVYDPAAPDTLELRSLGKTKEDVAKCRFAMIAVPTPTRADGSCNTDIVEEVVNWIESDYIIIRSTVSPGTTDRLRVRTGKRIVFQPEYVGETVSHPLLDHRIQNFVILGGAMNDTSAVAELYKRVFHSDLHIHMTDAKTAELTKYMENSFYAAKVAFCNEFFGIAKAIGVDYNELRELWLADPRISRDHTFVYPDDRGFSGKCLPKDMSAVIVAAEDSGYIPHMMREIMRINAGYRICDPTYDPYRSIPKPLSERP